MKKLLIAVLLVFATSITVFATETDLPEETIEETTEETPEEITEEPIEEITEEVEETAEEIPEEVTIDDIVDDAVDLAVVAENGEIPSATDVTAIIEGIKSYLASLEIADDAAGIGQYIKETLMPVIFQVLTSVAAIYGCVYPILLKIKNTKKKVDAAADKFTDAAADVKEAIAEKKAVTDMQNEITALKESSANMVETIKALKTENEGLTQEVQQLTGPVKDELYKITEAIKIGLCNTQELVNNGFAAKIIKELDGEEDAETETETDSD